MPQTPRDDRTLRVMLVAELCNPEWVSVPLVGWSHARAIGRLPGVSALIVTHARSREAFLRAGLREGADADFVCIDNDHVYRPLSRIGHLLSGGKGKGWTTRAALAPPAYYEFERLICKELGGRIDAGEFDVVHRLTPLSPTLPSSFLPRRCRRAGVPFVLGPLNGGVPWPKGYDGVRRQEREYLSYVRDAYKLLPGYRLTRKLAGAILVASRDTLEQMPAWARDNCLYMPENAVDPARFSTRRAGPAGSPLRLAFVGRLVPYKGADVLIEAVAPLARAGRVTLTVAGEGPQRGDLEALIARENVGGAVTLVGNVPHEKVQEILADADLFAFPSIREFGGGVVLEAMAVGVPCLVVAYGGPAELVTPATGVTVPIGPRRDLVARFRAEIEALCDDPRRVDDMGDAAANRVGRLFTWDAKARTTRRVYDWVMDPANVDKPDFPLPLPDDFELPPPTREEPERSYITAGAA